MNMDKDTKKYGVLGFPAKHSKSPYLFNKLFAKDQVNATYLFCEQEDTRKAIEGMQALGFSGASVTIPHKLKAFELVDDSDAYSQAMECVNTLHFKDDKIIGYNFDGKGALDALNELDQDWFKKQILIIGNGGAAQGIASAMAIDYYMKDVHFLVRNTKKAEILKQKLKRMNVNAHLHSFKDFKVSSTINQVDVVINTTPIGMSQDATSTPYVKEWMRAGQIVYDIVYVPQKTRLLREAESVGAKIIYGTEMFIGQAALQYQLWTDVAADKQAMRDWMNQLK